MRFTLILFDGVSELGRVAIGGVTVAARDQVIPTPPAASIEWLSRPTYCVGSGVA